MIIPQPKQKKYIKANESRYSPKQLQFSRLEIKTTMGEKKLNDQEKQKSVFPRKQTIDEKKKKKKGVKGNRK